MFYDKPYYLAPIGKAQKGYALLRETLKRSHKVGIAKVVIRTRQYLAALMPVGNVLVLEILRYPEEIRATDDLEVPGEDLGSVGVSPKELEMAERLVEGMTDRWDPSRYRDEYRDDLMAMIRAKAETGKVVTPRGAASEGGRSDVIDIMSLLKRSVQETEKSRTRPAAPARAKRGARHAEEAEDHHEKPAKRRKSA
jgi:DNA end-binding protein Ku